jgi:UDP-glucose 4-epimerase
MKVLVTGGAGLVGTSLCERLLAQGAQVFCTDDLSLGTQKHLDEHVGKSGFEFEKIDVSVQGWHSSLRGRAFDLMVHLAANSDISLGHQSPEMDARKTFSTTLASLMACRELKIPRIAFSSTSAVYGGDPIYPTPENTTELHPVSIYGAGKLASEAFISAFVENYGISAWVYRFGNVVGKRLTHGVIYDFNRKLMDNPKELQVLGNGRQTKTYIDVEDCVSGILWGLDKSPAGKSHRERFQVFNLSTEGMTSVREIAEESARVITRGSARIVYGDSSVGWIGDVPKTSLSVEKIFKLGWRPKLDSRSAVFQAIRSHYEWSQKG